MFNLSNETDYKLLSKTKNYYNFFILTTLFFFTSIFIRLIFLSFDNKIITLNLMKEIQVLKLYQLFMI